METEDMSIEVAEKDTAAEIAAEAAVADSTNRHLKRSSNGTPSISSSGLTTKGFRNTCQPCRLRKVRCIPGDGASCSNCDRLGFTCSFRDSSPQGDVDHDSPLSLPRRRVRLACINCHSRKARCSGDTPKCKRCRTQGAECVYRPTKRAAGGVNGGASGQAAGDSEEHESVSSEPPEKKRNVQDEPTPVPVQQPASEDQSSNAVGGPAPWVGPREPADHNDHDHHHHSLPLPDEALISRTFNNFFRHVHHVPVFSFLHRASLMQRYHAGMMDKALLLALVGITSLLTDMGPGIREYGAKCIDECQKIVLADVENPSTIKIQALVFIMKYRIYTRRFTGAFMLAATASRFAYALRLNYENTSLCFLARESRRRLMWAFLGIDSGINGGYTDFTLLPAEAMHIQLPCNERNFEFDLPQATEHLRPIPSKAYPDDVGSLALHVRLLWIRSRILYVSKNVLTMPETELRDLPRRVGILASELKSFNEFLPASFKFSESNVGLRAYSPRLCVFIMIHIWWRQCYCDLFRIVMPGLKEALPQATVSRLPHQFVTLCTRQCYEHAIAIAEIFRVILSLDRGLPVTDLDLTVCAYQCARLMYYGLQSNSSEFRLNAEQVHEHVQRCLQIARHMAHVPAGQAIHADLERLLARGASGSTASSHMGSPEPNGHGMLSQQVLSQHSPVQQMQIADENEIASMPIMSPSHDIPPPLTHGNLAVASANNQPPVIHPAVTAGPRPTSFAEVSMPGDPHMTKPNLPPVDPPDGLDNNNAFEGAMDGFDFTFEAFGNTGMDTTGWFSNEWLTAEYPQPTASEEKPPSGPVEPRLQPQTYADGTLAGNG